MCKLFNSNKATLSALAGFALIALAPAGAFAQGAPPKAEPAAQSQPKAATASSKRVGGACKVKNSRGTLVSGTYDKQRDGKLYCKAKIAR